MKVLVFGANGQVGTELVRRLPERLRADVVPVTRSGDWEGQPCETADLSEPEALGGLIERVKPDAVVNAAAYTAVDKAESEAEVAMRINGEAPAAIAKACADHGIPFVHYSTDYVFGGDADRPYLPEDATAPAGIYGLSKLAGEQAVQSAGGDVRILRTAWVYGLHGSNFLRTMLRLVDRAELGVVDDQIGSPTPAWLIAEVTAAMLRQGFRGQRTHHVVAGGQISWAGFADAIFDQAVAGGVIDARPAVKRITTADYPTPAKRPAYSVLSTESLKSEFSLKLPGWDECLKMTFNSDALQQAQSIQ